MCILITFLLKGGYIQLLPK